MKGLFAAGKRFYTDEKAAEVTELGIVLALIVALSVAAIGVIGQKVSTAFESVKTELSK
jgi:Flp pilus assembly pilin Flp